MNQAFKNRNSFRSGRRFSRNPRFKRFFRRVNRITKTTINRMAETKYSMKSSTFTQSDYGMVVTEITPTFAAGTSKFTAVGSKIKYRFIKVAGMMQALFTPSAQTNPIANSTAVRIVLVQGRQDLTTAAITDFFPPSSTNVTRAFDKLNPSYVRVLRDELYPLSVMGNPAGTYFGGVPAITFDFKVKINNDVTLRTNGIPSDPTDRYFLLVMLSPMFYDINTVDQVSLSTIYSCSISFIDV